MSSSRFSRLDALLVLVIFVWGANLSVIKVALREFPAQSFNALRLLVAAIAFLGVLAVRAGRRAAARRPRRPGPRPWPGAGRRDVVPGVLPAGGAPHQHRQRRAHLRPVAGAHLAAVVGGGARAAAVDALGRRGAVGRRALHRGRRRRRAVDQLDGRRRAGVRRDAVLGGVLGGLAAACWAATRPTVLTAWTDRDRRHLLRGVVGAGAGGDAVGRRFPGGAGR